MNDEKTQTGSADFEDKSLEKNPAVEEKLESKKIEAIDLTEELMEQLSVVARKLATSA